MHLYVSDKPARCQTVTWTNGHFSKKVNQNTKIYVQEIEIENVVCKMKIILSRWQCVNLETDTSTVIYGLNPEVY